jgi:large subunit ribosomal protein L35
MPKMKTNRAAAKRYSKTGGGKVKRGSAFRRHILTPKSSKTKRQLRGPAYVSDANIKEVERRLLPYG